MAETVRPTKKQKELLTFIEAFITQHGYSPSYREITAGCGYHSVATASLHINNLIKRGHLTKRDHSARSLEISKTTVKPELVTKQLKASEEKWLVQKVEQFFKAGEDSATLSERELDQLYVLVGALKVLGLEGASNSFNSRLAALKKKKTDSQYSV